jgi:hypothetical protein
MLAAIPALGYAVAFAYQAGFCDHFRLPWECIRLDVVPIALSIIGVYGDAEQRL